MTPEQLIAELKSREVKLVSQTKFGCTLLRSKEDRCPIMELHYLTTGKEYKTWQWEESAKELALSEARRLMLAADDFTNGDGKDNENRIKELRELLSRELMIRD